MFRQHEIKESPHSITLGKFVTLYPAATASIQKKLEIRLLVVRCHPCQKAHRKKETSLLYDGRHGVICGPESKETDCPLRCILLGADDRVRLNANAVDGFPPLSQRLCYRRKQFSPALKKPLWQHLGYQPTGKDDPAWCVTSPNSLAEVEDYVARFRPPETHVTIWFCTGLAKNSLVLDWFAGPRQDEASSAGGPPLTRWIQLLAYTDSNYGLAFAVKLDPELERSRRRGEKVMRDFDRYEELWKKLRAKEKELGETDARQANRASAVTAGHTGLNLAYDLGLLTLQELASISRHLGETHASMYVFLDEKHHLRHATYYDKDKTFCKEVPCFENDCADFNEGTMTEAQEDLDWRRRDEAAETMLLFWREVWDRRDHWTRVRRDILSPLTNRLETLMQLQAPPGCRSPGRFASPYSRCLADLKKMVNAHRVHLFSKEDSHLHSIKFYLTHFGYKTFKNFRGVSIKAQSDDALVKLSIPGLTVFNLYTYLCCKDDSDFYAPLRESAVCTVGPKPSQVFIQHAVKTLRFQKVSMSDENDAAMNASAYCKQYGWRYACHIEHFWNNFVQFLLDTFGFEFHGQTTLPSASYLAFQCVWTRYIRLAGPLAQGLERCKPHHEDLLREVSRGGFMYSAEEVLCQGDPLFPSNESLAAATTLTEEEAHSRTARSICEFDLISAYGYAASRCLVPSGFCTGFKKTETASEDGQLERLEPRARHKSFEFRAVYKVLDKLVRREGVAVRSVFHNYSSLGLFTLGGKYYLDLAVVTERGGLLLVNADGRWAHSCDVCLPGCSRDGGDFLLVPGKTHEELRAQSLKRDADILAWVDAFNQGSVASGGPADLASYVVIHDCHSPGYTTQQLERQFATEPFLANFVKGYRAADQCGKTLTADGFRRVVSSPNNSSDDSFTFIAKAQVTVVPPVASGGGRKGESEEFCRNNEAGPLMVYIDGTKNQEPTEEVPINYYNYNNSQGGRAIDDDADLTVDGRSKRRNTGRQHLAWKGNVVLTRDYYRYLEKTYGDRFQIDKLEWVLFFKTEPTLNAIYREMIDLRATTTDPVLVTFIKRAVNLSAGFFGARSLQLHAKTTYRLVNGAPKNYAFFRHNFDHYHSIDLEDESYFLMETRPWPKMANTRPPTKSAVPLFLTIVEYGKLRLVEIVDFLRRHLRPSSFRVVYSNVDNLIIGLACGADNLDEAVRTSLRDSYLEGKDKFFVVAGDGHDDQIKMPGLAELKWERKGSDRGWKFITLRTQHYCLSSNDPANEMDLLHKTSGWSNLTSREACHYAEEILKGHRVTVPQTRRIHKMSSMDTKPVLFQY